MPFHKLCLPVLLICSTEMVHGQVALWGRTVDAGNNETIADVYIRLNNNRAIRTVSGRDGKFNITLTANELKDTLSFSILGYDDTRLPVTAWNGVDTVDVLLTRNVTMLNTAEVSSERLRQRKLGIRKRGFPLHFTDGIFEPNSPFEIAQVIDLGNDPKRITSANLYITDGRADSATFSINFYKYANRQPGAKMLRNDITFKQPLRNGWLKLDLTPYRIYLHDSVMAAIRFIPGGPQSAPFNYEIKLGGASRSYYRRTESDSWHTPPHHYCMFVTALTENSIPDEQEDEGSRPAFALYSRHVKDSFSIFIHEPRRTINARNELFPLILVLDANAYFDQCRQLLFDRKMEDKITLVGIGYKNAYLMDSLRVRDYTFPKAPERDSLAVSGGAKAFLDFIRTELMPYLSLNHAIDTANSTLVGHSFGGYFVLYSLLNDLKQARGNNGFVRYVAASPSLHYADAYILKALNATTDSVGHIDRKRILVTMGEKEVSRYLNLDHVMGALNQKGADAGYKIYPSLEHMETVIPTFEDLMNTF